MIVADVVQRIPISETSTPVAIRVSTIAIVLPANGWVGDVPIPTSFALWLYYKINQNRLRTPWRSIK